MRVCVLECVLSDTQAAGTDKRARNGERFWRAKALADVFEAAAAAAVTIEPTLRWPQPPPATFAAT